MTTFRTVRISNPKFEVGGIRHITCKSPSQHKRVDTSVFIPDQAIAASDIPVIVLLHGVYGSHCSWNMGAGAYLKLQEMISTDQIKPFILITPSDGLWGDGSGYVDHGVENYEAWIGSELPSLIEQEIDEVSERSQFYIGGLSMGGWGAFWIGLKYPRYQAISAHSAITAISEMTTFVEEDWSLWQELNGISSLEELMTTINDFPPIRFDCGTADVLLKGNRALHHYMVNHRINHQYEEFAGGHEWTYWEMHVCETFRFFQEIAQQ